MNSLESTANDLEIRFGRPELLREVNARQLLRLLRMHGPCSRADLVRHSGLSAPTVSSAIVDLHQRGLVETVGPGQSNGGRRPSLLRFNPTLGYVIGTDIGRSVLRVGLADLSGTLVGRWIGETDARNTPESVAELVMKGVQELQSRHDIPKEKVLAIAASVPGITDPRSGIVISVPNFSRRWDSSPFRKILEQNSGFTAAVENDVNLAALGENWCGTARNVKDFVFLSIGTGVGAGIFVDGHLYHGSEWTAGEIAYLYVPGTEETPVALRRRGPLESVIGSKGIERFWKTLCRPRPGRSPRPGSQLGAVEILDLAGKEIPEARVVLNQTARILADAITNVCVILNSSLVVLGGRIGTHPALFEATSRIVERNEFSRPRLAVSSLGREAQLYGAVWLALTIADTKVLPPAMNYRGGHVSTATTNFSVPVLGFVPPG
ncbi:MAG TPA: ROK family transcriptional regulator [Terriglobia bacterium]|nr:ROK family transcriptional regulator [Terriglobia bacterium]